MAYFPFLRMIALLSFLFMIPNSLTFTTCDPNFCFTTLCCSSNSKCTAYPLEVNYSFLEPDETDCAHSVCVNFKCKNLCCIEGRCGTSYECYTLRNTDSSDGVSS